MRIGIYFTAGKNNGGVYQYSQSFLESLASVTGHEYVIITTSPDIPQKFFSDKRFRVVNLASPAQAQFEKKRTYLANVLGKYVGFGVRALYLLHLFVIVEWAMRYAQRNVLKAIDQEQLDLLIFPAGSDLSYLVNIPTIVAVHDLQHRLNPQFREVSAGGRYEYRENYYSKTCQTAVKILVDSQVGKEDVLSCYPDTDPSKIVILPFLPNPYLNKRAKKARFNTPYIYYPAHFWSHKNHRVLIEALHLLKSQGITVTLVTTGSKDVDFSTYPALLELAKKYHLTKQFKFLGYVSNDEVSGLYKGALALAMSTYFGPTNIPVLEAWSLGTPVIYSNIRGCREQLGNAGLLASPDSAEEWSEAIKSLLTSAKLRQELVSRGYGRLSNWDYPRFQARIKRMLKMLEL